ncbi:PP0621 family protein [Noviherbaspirillum agri]
MKLLLWSAVVLMVVVWVFRTKKISSDSQGTREANGNASSAGTSDDDGAVEPMLPCTHCGVHFPASEAVTSSSGAVFCTQEHRLRHGDDK